MSGIMNYEDLTSFWMLKIDHMGNIIKNRSLNLSVAQVLPVIIQLNDSKLVIIIIIILREYIFILLLANWRRN